MRGISFLEYPDFVRRDGLRHTRGLPWYYRDGEPRMRCIGRTVEAIRDDGYAHHLQRLIVTGNFALLAGLGPFPVHERYLAVFGDAYEWVEAPNVIGMSQFAEGGLAGSKPYVSSGNCIDRMSDDCGRCRYSPKVKTRQGACLFNLPYWRLPHRRPDGFERNDQMRHPCRTLGQDERRTPGDRPPPPTFLARIDAGEVV